MANLQTNNKEAQPLVSVCIGAYNKQPFIRETLDSVLNQTYQHIEIIVVDDASTDGTRGIIESYGNAIHLIQRTENSGICPVTRNEAVRHAHGDYVAFLDADDFWYPTKLEKQISFMQTNPNIALCHTYCHVVDENSVIHGIRHEGLLPKETDYLKPLLRHCLITISSSLIRKEALDRIGPFIEESNYGIWGEDHEFFLRVAALYEIGLVDEVLTAYRKSTANVSSGNWKCTPESVSFNRLILARKDIWGARVAGPEVQQALADNALSNSEYWSYYGYVWRVLYFLLLALRYDSEKTPSKFRTYMRLLVKSMRKKSYMLLTKHREP